MYHLTFYCCLLVLLLPQQAFPQVYRCTFDNGQVHYQDRPCVAGGSTQVVVSSGASAAKGLRDSEKQWLKSRQKAKPKPAKKQSNKSAVKALQRQTEKCWKKRKQLAEVNARLRRGYKPAQGDALRRQRAAHEDYVRQFCD